ncbi:exodeoxyribonuclease VII small subunit [Streptomyces sp. NPDC090025]|uniref:exodeoxyribonuclease VII small subunit n=1 Tax=Streptomyces sp. NPDC090025 TaxID=3365922 RepID=UPI003834D442
MANGNGNGKDGKAKGGSVGADAAGTAGTAEGLGYEQARDELIEVVRRLEAGGTSLEDSLALWERGEQLAKVCRHWLEGARARLDASLAAERAADGREEGADDA